MLTSLYGVLTFIRFFYFISTGPSPCQAEDNAPIECFNGGTAVASSCGPNQNRILGTDSGEYNSHIEVDASTGRYIHIGDSAGDWPASSIPDPSSRGVVINVYSQVLTSNHLIVQFVSYSIVSSLL